MNGVSGESTGFSLVLLNCRPGSPVTGIKRTKTELKTELKFNIHYLWEKVIVVPKEEKLLMVLSGSPVQPSVPSQWLSRRIQKMRIRRPREKPRQPKRHKGISIEKVWEGIIP